VATEAPLTPPVAPRRPRVGRGSDPAPLTPAVVRALLRAAGWQLARGLWAGRRRGAAWRRLAARIREPAVRGEALAALDGKRYFVDGAVLLWTLPDRPAPALLRLLADFQIAANLIDHAGEHGARTCGRTSTTLTGALVDAVAAGGARAGDDAPRGDLSDPYADHPWSGDDGYLRALVDACRAGCAALPGHTAARETLVREAALAQALELTHHPDPALRAAALQRFAVKAHPGENDLRWFELAAGDASAMTVLAILALAAEPGASPADRAATVRAYRWVAALSTMLDSHVDRDGDERSGDWSAVAPYGDRTDAVSELAALVDRTLREVAALRHGPRHVVVVCAMVAMFLSGDEVRDDPATRTLVDAGGTLTRRLVPVLRAWRAVSSRD
jgi:tetraprenyl-beta-curcumene synthase